ncbi:hypothetical protein CANARDRAFT_202037 [[Candida] arabinofermentans NRRL YB-2248]|uniref:tRNA (guanine(26)-N(2))-dimethyltransferase n=1 Tax=[Candida] arabinofermentans NRRL YB-2248 TaxID=983967 RepID=A0A1E4SWJ4_9ASCO|nr:hypothetical protein CANARDRAFT_202037 [[Candida] arabinofermentans NRRL YB-2248]
MTETKLPTAESVASIDTKQFEVLKEGTASVLFPANKVFYNPVQQYNRDLSTLAIQAWSEIYADSVAKSDEKFVHEPFIQILEALSATGLRAIRYGKEIPLVSRVIANDMSKSAVESIQRNILHNEISSKVSPNESDAISYMHSMKSQFHVVDLDPYGTATPFMDGAINAIKDDGLLLVTCTDLGVLAGNGYPEKCFALYGGTNVWGDATHESALRLVLGMIANTAARQKKFIEPVLCLSIDFYVRLFIKVSSSPLKVKELASKTMITYKCSGCHSTHDQYLGKCTTNENAPEGNKQLAKKFGLSKGPPIGTLCPYCGFANHVTGPMWGGKLQDATFIDKVLELQKGADPEIYGTLERIKGMLTMAKNELNTNFYFKTTTLSSVLKCSAPPIETIVTALGNLGYEASLTHAMTSAIKTNAPWEAVWFIGKKYCEKTGHTAEKMSKTGPGYNILINDDIGKNIDIASLRGDSDEEKGLSDLEWLFTETKDNLVVKRVRKLRNVKIVRYQENPTKNWGPKARPH